MCHYELGAMFERGGRHEQARARYQAAALQLEQAASSPLMIPKLDGPRIYGLLGEIRRRQRAAAPR